MKYRIEVRGIGYEDYAVDVDAPSLREAKRHELKAKVDWCEHNDIDVDSSFEMPFTRVTKI
jgi:hypothetical protein